jgi:hypothetical protein
MMSVSVGRKSNVRQSLRGEACEARFDLRFAEPKRFGRPIIELDRIQADRSIALCGDRLYNICHRLLNLRVLLRARGSRAPCLESSDHVDSNVEVECGLKSIRPIKTRGLILASLSVEF